MYLGFFLWFSLICERLCLLFLLWLVVGCCCTPPPQQQQNKTKKKKIQRTANSPHMHSVVLVVRLLGNLLTVNFTSGSWLFDKGFNLQLSCFFHN